MATSNKRNATAANSSIFDRAEMFGQAKSTGDKALWSLAIAASAAMWGDKPEIKFSGDEKARDAQHVAACAKLASRFGVGAGGKAGEKSEKAYADKLRNWLRQELHGKLESIEKTVQAFVDKTTKSDRNKKGFVDIALTVASKARKDAKLAIDSKLCAAICKPKDGEAKPTPTKEDKQAAARDAFEESCKAMMEQGLVSKAMLPHLKHLAAALKISL